MKRSYMFSAALTAAFSLWALPAVHAQVTVAPPTAYPGAPSPYPGAFPARNPGYGYYPGAPQQQPMVPPSQTPAPQQTAAPPVTLPQGINKIYANEGNESLLVIGTQQGYDTAEELVKLLDGDLDIISTQIALAQTTQAEMAVLGVTVPQDGALSSADIQTLVTAEQDGKLPVSALDRVITREDTVIGVLMGKSDLPLTFVPRVEKNDMVGVQLTQPISLTASARPGSTSVVALPPTGTGPTEPVTLLFLTPKILPSDYRP
jgi:hypothetical protein